MKRPRSTPRALPLILAACLSLGCSADAKWNRLSAAGTAAVEAGRLEDAERHYTAALELAEREGWQDQRLVDTLNELGRTKRARGEVLDSLPLFDRALAVESALDPDPAELAAKYNRLAVSYQASNQPDKARDLHERALALRESVLGKDHPDLCESLNNLALLDLFEGRTDEAEQRLLRSIEIMRSRLLAEHPNLAVAYTNLAQVHQARQDLAAAETDLRSALKVLEQNNAPDSVALARGRHNLAELLRLSGQPDEAEQLYLAAIDALEGQAEEQALPLAGSLNNLALLYRQQERYGEAETYYELAIDVLERADPDHRNLVTLLFNLGRLHERQSSPADAAQDYARALAFLDRNPDLAPRELSLVLRRYAGVLRELDRPGDAAALEARLEALDTP